MSEGGFPQLQQQIANLNAAQRVGIVAAVALSSFTVYATKKHKSICGGPVDSPRHRDACSLNFLTCAPSNDINESIATIQDTLASTAMEDFDMDTPHWSLLNITIPGIPKLRRQLEPLLGCPHDAGFGNHPHAQICLQCNDRHRASNALDRAYMDWSWTTAASSPLEDEASTSASPPLMRRDPTLLRCPHNQKISPQAPAYTSCAERSYTGAVHRARMSNWTSSPGSPGSPTSENSSTVSSFKSMLSPELANLASGVNLSEGPMLGDVGRMMGAASAGVTASMGSMGLADAASRGGDAGLTSPELAVGAALRLTTLYFIFWYLCTLCNDQ